MKLKLFLDVIFTMFIFLFGLFFFITGFKELFEIGFSPGNIGAIGIGIIFLTLGYLSCKDIRNSDDEEKN